MDLEELQKIAKVAAKHLKTEQDLNEFSAMLTKISVEAALNAELDEHLSYDILSVSVPYSTLPITSM